MSSRQFGDQFRKETMSRTQFLTYKQGISFAIPGSRQESVRDSWKVLRDVVRRVKVSLSGASLAAELWVREFVLSDLILAFYIAYAFAAKIPSGIAERIEYHQFAFGKSSKRVIDIVGATVGLALLSPLFALVAIAIKLDSTGPVFFTQMRIGMNRRRSFNRRFRGESIDERRARDRRRKNLYGRPFRVYKFRSMVDNAEKRSGPIWASKNDPRITRVGSFLRKTRLDELPQLLNVLKGEMSLVGPRPERLVFIESLSRDIADYPRRLDVKPGITGLAQVITGYDTSISSVRAKVKEDLRYINDWTLIQDLKILMKTVIVVITGKGAF
jgi:lipopolysaccharide/colanic/teichoic acid biosynthesis glycosyltransferase